MKRELAKLIAGQVCLHACMTGMRMAAPLMALRSGQSEAAVGVLLALFALTQVFLALPAGRYADQHGLKRPVMWSVLTSFVGAGMAALWPIFPVLCVSALMTGGATGAAVIALQRHVGRAAEDLTQLKQAFSWLAIGPAISNFIGPFTAGLLIDHAGFQWAYGAMAVLPLLAWCWVRKTRELPSYVKPEGHEKNSAWDLLNAPMFRRLMLVNWFLSACWDVHTFVVPIMGHERGLSASAIGSILGAFAIAAAIIVKAKRDRGWTRRKRFGGVQIRPLLADEIVGVVHPAVLHDDTPDWPIPLAQGFFGEHDGAVHEMAVIRFHRHGR